MDKEGFWKDFRGIRWKHIKHNRLSKQECQFLWHPRVFTPLRKFVNVKQKLKEHTVQWQKLSLSPKKPNRWRSPLYLLCYTHTKQVFFSGKEWQRKILFSLITFFFETSWLLTFEFLWEKSRNVLRRDGDGDKNQTPDNHSVGFWMLWFPAPLPLRGHRRWGTSDSEKS